MPTDMSYVTQSSQIGAETVYGTAVPALKRMAGIGFMCSPDVTTDPLERAGFRFPSIISPGKVKSKVTFSGKPAYDDLVYIASGVHKVVTPTTPGGGTNSRLWTYPQSSTDEDTVQSYTIEYGSRKLARRIPGAIFTGYNFSWDTNACNIAGEGFGGKMVTGIKLSTNEVQTITRTGTVTSGTFDITTITNPVTLEVKSLLLVPYDTTAAALQTLFDALWGTGLFLVAGGPLGGTPITVEFIGNFGGQNVVMMVAVSTNLVGGGSYGITTTTPGVTPADLTAFDLQPNHIKVYMNDTYATIGTTKLTRVFSGAFALGSMREALHVVDRDQLGSPVGYLEGKPTNDFKLRIMANETSDTLLDTLYIGATRYFRVEGIGGLIEGALARQAIWDIAAKVQSIGEYGPEGNALALDFNMSIVHDASFGRAVSLAVQNTVTAL